MQLIAKLKSIFFYFFQITANDFQSISYKTYLAITIIAN